MNRYHRRPMTTTDLSAQYGPEEDVSDDVLCVSHIVTGKRGRIRDMKKMKEIKIRHFYIGNIDLMKYYYKLAKKVRGLFWETYRITVSLFN